MCSTAPDTAPHAALVRSGEAGYTLVIFIMAIAIMSIMMGVAVQAVSFSMQREREAELIFRGEQYMEAIRLFKAKYGRYPVRMKEIWEAKPRVVRKKWKDPITDSEKWGIIFFGEQGRRRTPGQPGDDNRRERDSEQEESPFGIRNDSRFRDRGNRVDNDGRRSEGAPSEGARDGEQSGGLFGPQEGEKVGPIIGVHSTSCEDSIKVYEGRTSYCDWEFVYREDREQGRGVVPPGVVIPPGRGPGGLGDPRTPAATPNRDDGSDKPPDDRRTRVPRATGTPYYDITPTPDRYETPTPDTGDPQDPRTSPTPWD